MRKTKVICLLLMVVFINCVATGFGADKKSTVKYTGRVVDNNGKAIEGAKVQFYEIVYDQTFFTFDVKLIKEVETKADGAFSITVEKSEESQAGIILANKQGLAIGWANWYTQQGDKDFEIKLTEPKEVAGIVVDENDAPLAEAEVSIFMLMAGDKENRRYLTRRASRLLTTTTDNAGKFAFGNLPLDATAEFAVKKAGRATVNTFNLEGYRGENLQFAVGQSDIKIVQPVEAKIEGKVVEKGGDKGISDARVLVVQQLDHHNYNQEFVVSNTDGSFSIEGLTEGKWFLKVVRPKDKAADWVAEPVEVTVKAGKTVSDVKVEVSKGGLLEIVITDAAAKKPIDKVHVGIRNQKNNQYLSTRSDEKGLAKIRLMPGEYEIQGVYKQGYSSNNQQENITIEDGKTVRLDIQLSGQPTITGVVRDKRGKAVSGADIKVLPVGHSSVKTDDEGMYEVKWDPRSWGSQQDMVYYLVVRLPERNLAAAFEIDEDTRQKDVKLSDGVIFTGKVVDPNDKAIEKARIMVMLRASGWGSTILSYQKRPTTNGEGKFEVKAIPADCKYNVIADADGYGKSRVEALAEDAVNGRLDVGKLTLALANLSVTGMVVDADGKPVADARIHTYGEGQPDSRNIKSDKDGKFTIEKICAGRINISANVQGKTRLYGHIETEGGTKDVKVMVSEQGGSRRYVPKQPASLVGKDLPDVNSFGIELSQAKDKKVLVCFFDYQQRPSRHCVRQLAKKAEQLKEKDVTVVIVQTSKIDKGKLDEWVSKYEIGMPVGMLEADEDKTRFAWGVKALPWLILTDESHTVKAEGFSPDEIDEKIKGIDGKQ